MHIEVPPPLQTCAAKSTFRCPSEKLLFRIREVGRIQGGGAEVGGGNFTKLGTSTSHEQNGAELVVGARPSFRVFFLLVVKRAASQIFLFLKTKAWQKRKRKIYLGVRMTGKVNMYRYQTF